MRTAVLIISLLATFLLSGSVFAAGDISVSDPHAPKYVNAFTRFYLEKPAAMNVTGYNFTINYTKIPRVLQGETPQLPKPNDLEQDVVRKAGPVLLDPRTCPHDLAYCYQVLERNVTPNITAGSNYSRVSTYVLPSARIKNFVCIGDDAECVQSATNCYCPTISIGPPPIIWRNSGCSDTTHLCLNSYGSFKLCEGNLTSCREQYDSCGCGRRAACVSQRNACVNERNEIVLCAGGLSDCLAKYKTCYCGDEMLYYQLGCGEQIHSCEKDNRTFTCYGSFNGCALQADKCSC